jgi:regulator of RNase E activity RraA
VHLPLRSFGGRRAFSGELRTVRCHEDNVVLRRTPGEPGDGRVLVVDGGWAGIVINGCTRRFRCDRVVCDR